MHHQRLELAREAVGLAAGVIAAAGVAGGVFALAVQGAEVAIVDGCEQVAEEGEVGTGFIQRPGQAGDIGVPEQIRWRAGGNHRVAVVEQGLDGFAFVVQFAQPGIAVINEIIQRKKRALVENYHRPTAWRWRTGRALIDYFAGC